VRGVKAAVDINVLDSRAFVCVYVRLRASVRRAALSHVARAYVARASLKKYFRRVEVETRTFSSESRLSNSSKCSIGDTYNIHPKNFEVMGV
jgi:hypothetical protein